MTENKFINKFQYLYNSLQDLWKLIKTKKAYFPFLIILQLISISLFSYIIIVASITTAADLQDLTDPLAALDFEDPNISEQDILIQGSKMYAAYETLSKHIQKYLLMSMLVFFTLPGFLWSISSLAVHNLHSNQSKEHSSKFSFTVLKSLFTKLISYYKTYLISSGILYLPFAILAFLLGNLLLQSELVVFTNAAQIFVGILVILTFLWLATLSVPTSYSWRSHVKKTKQLISTKFWYFLLTIIIVTIPIAASIYFLHYTTLVHESFPLMLLAAFLVILIIILARLYLIIVAKHLLSSEAKN